MTPENTPRMAERTDRQAQTDPWEQWRRIIYPHIQPEVFVRFLNDHTAEGWDGTRAEMDALTTVLDAARAADAALLRERDAQIASLTAANASFTAAATVRVETAEAVIASLTAQVEQQKRDIAFKDDLIWASRVAELYEATIAAERDAKAARAERDAAQQEAAKWKASGDVMEAEKVRALQDAINLQQENKTLREALKAAWCELIQHDDQPWVKTLAGQVRVVGLFAFPRPQEPQP